MPFHDMDDQLITLIPKVELHLHLDTSLSYEGVLRLRPSVTPDEFARDYVAPRRCADLTEFLCRSPKGYGLLQSRDALRIVVEDVFEQLVADNVIYVELRFAPFLHLERGLTPSAVVDIVDAAVTDMSNKTGVEARLILCTLRHYSEGQSMATVKLVDQFRDRRVVAFDLAGDEAGFPIGPHVAAFRYAHEVGIKTTAHAGEARGPESVWETLELLAPSRIGHGIRSSEDPTLVELLRCTHTHLEVCPSSNVQLVESIQSWTDHPIERLRTSGVSLNINCDNRMLNGTSLNREYELVATHFRWTTEEFLVANRNALRHAFIDEGTRMRLGNRLMNASL